jgi:D-lyxose ketol-isomerase
MKRSEVNRLIGWAQDLLESIQFKLPMFGYWKYDEWKAHKDELDVVRKTVLGWDVTDFGSGDFDTMGAVLFTLRNGNVNEEGCGTPYAEKVILMKDGQVLPLHYHFEKSEDIINRGGGVLQIQLYNSKPDGSVDEQSDVSVYCDGIKRTVEAGGIVDITPGNSITLVPYVYHKFISKKGGGDLIVGEVSKINDDSTDNKFLDKTAYEVSAIEEDEPIVYPLNSEFNKVL